MVLLVHPQLFPMETQKITILMCNELDCLMEMQLYIDQTDVRVVALFSYLTLCKNANSLQTEMNESSGASLPDESTVVSSV